MSKWEAIQLGENKFGIFDENMNNICETTNSFGTAEQIVREHNALIDLTNSCNNHYTYVDNDELLDIISKANENA